MSLDFEPEEQMQIKAAVSAGQVPHCPSCSGRLDRTMIPPRNDVSYVRRRVWVTCSPCGKSLVLDQRKVK